MELKYLLFLLPYLIIPVIISYIFKRGSLVLRILSYLATTIILILYTILLQVLSIPAHAEEGGYICAPPVLIIIIPLLPIGLIVQAVAGWAMKR